MDDMISRQDAIDALDKHIDTFDAIDTNYLCGLRTAMSFLKKLPSAQPTTTWLGNYCPYKCKHCGKHTDSKTPFCAWCGRKASNYEV